MGIRQGSSPLKTTPTTQPLSADTHSLDHRVFPQYPRVLAGVSMSPLRFAPTSHESSKGCPFNCAAPYILWLYQVASSGS